VNVPRRFVSMVLGATSVVLAGFVVAVAARSRPGGPGEESLLETDIRFDIDLGRLFAWVIFVMAMIGAVFVVMGLKGTKKREDRRKRSLFGAVLGVLVFLLILRAVQPLADTMLNANEVTNAAEGESGSPAGSSGSAAWLFSLLLAALVAAALTRVGLTVRDGSASFDQPLPEVPAGPSPESQPEPSAFPVGTDPRSRVLAAYDSFERNAAVRDVPRGRNETAARHARRTATELGLAAPDVEGLTGRYSSSRFGQDEVSVADAETAEAISEKLGKDMTS
jgi:hypothetical protein